MSRVKFTIEDTVLAYDMEVNSGQHGIANKWRHQSDDARICVVMVGLPARGKSLIAGKGMYYSCYSDI